MYSECFKLILLQQCIDQQKREYLYRQDIISIIRVLYNDRGVGFLIKNIYLFNRTTRTL